ncbi:hypothetical protein BWQ96_07468 [Gracilariopsis chorda]|uniref:C2H2-type domain-containing protein n=1 Tax=Gracilariopsis chorda TaxID=448386 RepID=A0A2V3IL96_9FLOR|nr:hypothetical protein BWQ96_07468 [Gracilariopsis chorda]|eukprot:PXF42817.1 hypothetical protein BWQ96_07468 [Gracilariopsis chorda]
MCRAVSAGVVKQGARFLSLLILLRQGALRHAVAALLTQRVHKVVQLHLRVGVPRRHLLLALPVTRVRLDVLLQLGLALAVVQVVDGFAVDEVAVVGVHLSQLALRAQPLGNGDRLASGRFERGLALVTGDVPLRPAAAAEQSKRNQDDDDATTHSFIQNALNPSTVPSTTPAQATINAQFPLLSPRPFALSPRLPSALPPSASPRVVEPVTPDRQPLPFSTDDPAVLCATAPLGTVDERAAAILFDTAPRRVHTRSAPPPAHHTDPDKIDAALSLQLPIDPVSSSQPLFRPSQASAPSLAWEPNPLISNSAASAAAVAAAAVSTTLPAQKVLSPFGLAPAPPVVSPYHWGKDPADPLSLPMPSRSQQPRLSPLPVPAKPRHNNRTLVGAAATAAAATAAAVAAANATAPCFTSSPTSGLAATAAPSPQTMPDITLLPSPTVARTLTEIEPMSDVPPRPAPISRHDSHQKKVRIHKVAIPNPTGVATSSFAPPDTTSDPLRCNMCGQRFARRSNLFKHLRSVHDDRRRFACQSCQYKFKRQDHLLKHRRSVHAGLRKFACDICGFGFAEKFNRDKHRRSIHMTQRAFQCPCGAYFQDREKMLKCLRCKERAIGLGAATAAAASIASGHSL